ncbi:MAG TPA: Crp/Fnr family transcriptional regulator [Mycobacterium sp.]|nr:Crp/Fnr family transcriptional regulator [Mycobacterium sp.]
MAQRASGPTLALNDCALLVGQSPEVKAAFRALAHPLSLSRNETLFSEGDAGGSIYVVLSGKLKVTRPADDGKETIFTIVGPDDLLGELAVFDDGHRQATAVALRPCELVVASNVDVRAWFDTYPATLRRFSELLVARVRRLNDSLEDVYGLDVATRLARVLVRQSAQFGRRTGLGVQVDLDLSQEELALHVRASRERVNQVINDFARRGWLRREASGIVVVDWEALEHRARFRDEVAQRRVTRT